MLTISILNYRNWQATIRCVQEVAAACASSEFRILIRDNSEEPELELIRGALAEARFRIDYFASPDNPGFGGGHNSNFLEVEHDPTDQFLILNNDIRISDPFCIRAMLDLSREDRIVSCVVRNSRTNDIWFAGGRINSATGDLAILHNELEGDLWETDFVSGCCMMIPVPMFQELGGFDESFFMYGEDLDLCLRARDAGAHMVLVNHSLIHEVGSGQRGHYSDLYLYEGTKNRIRTLKKHKLGLPVLRTAYCVAKYGIARSVQLMFYSSDRGRQIITVWRGIVDGYRGYSAAMTEGAPDRRRCKNDARTTSAGNL
jgi:GT2 family glycosyltransferase